MIEELNSDEDGLSKYFSNLKTSDAVIDKLIIPRIEEKQNYIVSEDDCSLETMLIEYAKHFSRQQETIKERDTLLGFHDALVITKKETEKLWLNNNSKENYIKKLFACSDALGSEIVKHKQMADEMQTELDMLDKSVKHIRWEKVSAQYYDCKETLEQETIRFEEAQKFKTTAETELENAEKSLRLLECAHYFNQLKNLENRISVISEEIADREGNTESAEKLASLKYSAYIAIQKELTVVTPEIEKLTEERNVTDNYITQLNKEIDSIRKNIEIGKIKAGKDEAVLDRIIRENDTVVEELNIDAYRMLDGCYRENEFKSWEIGLQKKEKSISDKIITLQSDLKRLETRKEDIPQEIADAKVSRNRLQAELNEINDRLSKYYSAKEMLKTIYEKHDLDFSFCFTDRAADYLNELITTNEASILDDMRKIEATEEAVAAVERGTLHIPKMLIDYLDNTGIQYTGVEKYILTQKENGRLSKEDCLDILERYPFAAYGVIVNPSDMATLLAEAEETWLPAVLPLLTMNDVEAMLHGGKTTFTSVCAYSKDYFSDSVAYVTCLKDTLDKQYAQKKMHELRRESLASDIEFVKAFSVYDAGWEEQTLSERDNQESSISDNIERCKMLLSEQQEIKDKINGIQNEVKRYTAETDEIRKKFTAFEKLIEKLAEENSLRISFEDMKKQINGLSRQLEQKTAENETIKSRYSTFVNELTGLEAKVSSLHKGLDTVTGATESAIIDDEWTSLLSRYEQLRSEQSADLERLNEDKVRLAADMNEKKKEILKRDCRQDEYENLIYTEVLENNAVRDKKAADDARRTAESEYSKVSHIHAKAEALYENVLDKLKEFGGEILPANDIGKSFDERIADIKIRIKEVEKNIRSINAEQSELQKVLGKAEIATEKYQKPENYNSIQLDTDYTSQLNSLIKQISNLEECVKKDRLKVENHLNKMATDYGLGSADVSHAVSSMQELISNETVSGDRYYTLCEHMETNIHTVHLRISQIDTDLKEFSKTKGDLIQQCVIQGRMMYEGLKQLSANSKVKVQNKRIQMLKFDIPDVVDENVSNVAIAAEIDKCTEEIVSRMAEDNYSETEIRRISERAVGSKRLLRKYIGCENIILRAYKIDRNPGNSGYRTWAQTQVNNSGAEKFVVYFAVILAIMTYTRDGYDDSNGKNNRSVLILDNPFGPISSRHVLEPMFEISKNYNVQMICLSDISKSDIISCFDLVIRAVVRQFALSSKEQLTHEGNELIEHGYYRSEQIELS